MVNKREPVRLKDGDLRAILDGFAGGEKAPDNLKIGTEYENFATMEPSKRPMPYRAQSGGASVQNVLKAFKKRLGWESLLDDGTLIGLLGEGASVQLEPSGQVEFSGAPHETIHATVEEIGRFEQHKEALKAELGLTWLWAGHHPLWTVDDFDLMPKRRYGIMRRYLPTRGALATEMMHQTTTVQANLDYTSEPDMGSMLRTAMGASSILACLFANSPLGKGRLNGYQSYRNRIWEEVDPDRCGLLPWIFEGAPPSYEQYARWAMQVPLFFVVRDGTYVDCAGLPFQRFVRHGFEGHRATLDDWNTHLSTLFPDVRLKTYLELRVADCVPPAYLPALPALSKGMLYHRGARDAIWDLVKHWTYNERLQHRVDAAKEGLQASTPGGHRTLALAKELLSIVNQALAELAQAGGYEDESCFVEPLAELIRSGRSPADKTLEWVRANSPTEAEMLAHYTYDWTDAFPTR